MDYQAVNEAKAEEVLKKWRKLTDNCKLPCDHDTCTRIDQCFAYEKKYTLLKYGEN